MGRDILSDIRTSIRNADIDQVQIVSTKITKNIVKRLWRDLENVRSQKSFFVSTLRHRKTRKGNQRIWKRISRPGLRIYSNYQRIPKILGGMGIVILSTYRGIMTDREARLEEEKFVVIYGDSPGFSRTYYL